MISRTMSRIAIIPLSLVIATGCPDDSIAPPSPPLGWFNLPPKEMQATLSGEVRLAGQPAPGVEVQLSVTFPYVGRAMRTDINGRFSFDAFPEGDHDVVLWLRLPSAAYVAAPLDALSSGADRVREMPDSVFLVRSQHAPTVRTTGPNRHDEYRFNIDLDPYGIVTGFVVDPNDVPVPAVHVVMRPHGGPPSAEREVVSDGDGAFSFLKTKGGSLDVGLSAEAQKAYLHLNHTQLEGIVLEPGATLRRNVRVGASGTIEGFVRLPDNSGISGATLTLRVDDAPTTTSSTDGFYRLRTFAGEHTLSITPPPGYTLPAGSSSQAIVKVLPGRIAESNWQLVPIVAASGTIVARVLNSGERYAGATVRLVDENRSATTGANGEATFATVSEGAHQLTLTLPTGFVPDLAETVQKSTSVSAGQTREVTWTIVNVGSGISSIAGTVSVAGGSGLGGVVLTLSTGATATTAANGTYAFPDVPAGVYEMTITVPAPYTLPAGQTKRRVVVRPSEGAPMVNWSLLRP